MSKRAAGFALFCALVGLAVSAAAAYTHYHMLYDPSYRSFCDVSETVSCTQVYASRFSTFQGIPVAIFGALWFVVAALLSIAGLTARTTVAFFPRESVTAGAIPETTQDQRSELERFMATAPRIPIVIPSEGAKVLIVKFNDFQCPACGQSYLQYKPILAKYEASNPGQVKMVLKDYPLNPSCNDNLTNMIHPSACDAAVAVRLAMQRNRGEAMEEWLYNHQPQMTPPAVRQA